MIDLVVVTFNDRERAAAALSDLRTEAAPWTARLHGSSVVYRDHAGKLAIDERFETTKGNDAIAGGFTGSLVGLLLAVMALPVLAAGGPLVAGGAMVAGALGGEVIGSHHRAGGGDADAKWWRDEVGVNAGLAQQVQAMLGRGDSAIICLLRQPDPELAARFAKLGGTAHTISLTTDQAAKVDARLPV